MDKILVTGAAGFIGSFLTQRLLKEGYQVIGIDNFFRGKEENLKLFIDNPNFRFARADVTQDLSDDLFKDIQAVFHYAAINGTAYFYERPLEVLNVNVEGTINVLKKAIRHNVKKFVFASSSEVYGEPQCFPTNEQQPIVLPNVDNPRYSYAASKAMGEYYVYWYSQKSGMTPLIFRIFNTYGPRMDTSGYGQVVPEFARKMFQNKEFTIIGPGNQTRSFCYIDDNIEMAIRAFKTREGNTLNIGNSEEIAIIKLAEIMHKIEGKEFHYKLLPPLKGDHYRRLPDISKVMQLTGYKPQIELEEGLKISLKFWKEQL